MRDHAQSHRARDRDLFVEEFFRGAKFVGHAPIFFGRRRCRTED
jgi:hypothetical protein